MIMIMIMIMMMMMMMVIIIKSAHIRKCKVTRMKWKWELVVNWLFVITATNIEHKGRKGGIERESQIEKKERDSAQPKQLDLISI